MRLRKKPWITERIQEFSHILVDKPYSYKGKWHQYFQNDSPLHVEVGTGKGRFITTLAQQNSAINYIGLEYMQDVIYYAAQKVTYKQLKNIALLCFDVNHILDVFHGGEISRLYINFCDPWPKNRHAKRRLTHHGFLIRYAQILAPGGEIHFKTDNEQLFAYSLNEFAAERQFQLKNITFDLHNSEFAGNVMTEYEEKFSSRGMKIFRCEAQLLR
jgi:tRNA (guanine-N7-)-methyltransferase